MVYINLAQRPPEHVMYFLPHGPKLMGKFN